MLLYWLHQTGNRPVALDGLGHRRVGDPTGKDESRRILSAEDIEQNTRGIARNFEPFFKFGTGPNDPIMADNADWLLKLNYVDFARGRPAFLGQPDDRPDAVSRKLERNICRSSTTT